MAEASAAVPATGVEEIPGKNLEIFKRSLGLPVQQGVAVGLKKCGRVQLINKKVMVWI